MENDVAPLVVVLVLALLVWLLVLSPSARAARAKRRQRAIEERKRIEAERARLKAERDELLNSVRANAPAFIREARRNFEREYSASGGQGSFGQEMSPLVCFGYRVGKTSPRTDQERHTILEYATAVDLDLTLPFLPASYRSDWGAPLSTRRFDRIYHHINNMADLRDGRPNFDVAVSQWRDDAAWLQTHVRGVVEKYHGI